MTLCLQKVDRRLKILHIASFTSVLDPALGTRLYCTHSTSLYCTSTRRPTEVSNFDRQFVACSLVSHLCHVVIRTSVLKQHPPGPHVGNEVVHSTFALAHPHLQGLLGDGDMGEDTYPQSQSLSSDCPHEGQSGCLNLCGSEADGLQGVDTVVTNCQLGRGDSTLWDHREDCTNVLLRFTVFHAFGAKEASRVGSGQLEDSVRTPSTLQVIYIEFSYQLVH